MLVSLAKGKGVVSRRDLIAATGGGVGYSLFPAGIKGLCASESTSRAHGIHPLPLRRQVVRVAAIQGAPQEKQSSRNGFDQIDHLIEDLRHVRRQLDGVDLIVVSAHQLHRSSSPGLKKILALISHETKGVYVAFAAHYSLSEESLAKKMPPYLISADGVVHEIPTGGPSIVSTDIGVLGFSSGSLFPQCVDQFAGMGAEILVHNRSDGPAGDEVSPSAKNNGLFSIAVAGSRIHAKGVATATAVYGNDGKILTQAGAPWRQAVTARLPIAALRSQRNA